MIGALIGDFVGSRFESSPIKTKDFQLVTSKNSITDDSVLTIAIADCLMNDTAYNQNLKTYYQLYPRAGFGASFHIWASSDQEVPYYSFGNGSAMRVSPVGWYFDSLEEILEQAKKSAEVTHNHPEGIKGAQAVATAIFLSRQAWDKKSIREEIQTRFQYDLTRTVEEIRPGYSFDVTCQGSVPEAIICFLESTDFEDAIRNAISLGGDTDTQGCIAGSIAEAYYKQTPRELEQKVLNCLDSFLYQKVTDFLDLVSK